MYSAIAIANYFIMKAGEYSAHLSNMHIQKMVFFAHAAYFKSTGTPLIQDPVLAWQHGPVIERLYHALRQYGNRAVDTPIKTVVPCSPGTDYPCKLVIPEVPMTDKDTVLFLNRAWDVFGMVETWRLRMLSHEEGGAWYTTIQNYAKSIGQQGIDPKDDQAVARILPRNLVILDPVIQECGR